MTQRFVARSKPSVHYKAILLVTGLGTLAVVAAGHALAALLPPMVVQILSPIFYLAVPLGLGGAILYVQGRTVTLDIEGDRLVVDQGRGGVFPLSGAALGRSRLPVGEGTILQLTSGARRLRILGVGHRPRPGVRLALQPDGTYDAYVAAAKSFQDLLDLVPIPADHAPPPEVLRCELFGHWRFMNEGFGSAPDGEILFGLHDVSLRDGDGRTVYTLPLSALVIVRGMHTLPKPFFTGPRPTYTAFTHAVLQLWVGGRCAVAIGVGEDRIGWRDPTSALEAPRYMVGTMDWEAIVARLGLGAWMHAPPPD